MVHYKVNNGAHSSISPAEQMSNSNQLPYLHLEHSLRLIIRLCCRAPQGNLGPNSQMIV